MPKILSTLIFSTKITHPLFQFLNCFSLSLSLLHEYIHTINNHFFAHTTFRPFSLILFCRRRPFIVNSLKDTSPNTNSSNTISSGSNFEWSKEQAKPSHLSGIFHGVKDLQAEPNKHWISNQIFKKLAKYLNIWRNLYFSWRSRAALDTFTASMWHTCREFENPDLNCRSNLSLSSLSSQTFDWCLRKKSKFLLPPFSSSHFCWESNLKPWVFSTQDGQFYKQLFYHFFRKRVLATLTNTLN